MRFFLDTNLKQIDRPKFINDRTKMDQDLKEIESMLYQQFWNPEFLNWLNDNAPGYNFYLRFGSDVDQQQADIGQKVFWILEIPDEQTALQFKLQWL